MDLEALKAGIVAAHNAGDTAGATRLAEIYKEQTQAQVAEPDPLDMPANPPELMGQEAAPDNRGALAKTLSGIGNFAIDSQGKQLHFLKEALRGAARGAVGIPQALDDLSGTTKMREMRGSDFKYQDIYDKINTFQRGEPVPYVDATAQFAGEAALNAGATGHLMPPASKYILGKAREAAKNWPLVSKLASATGEGIVGGTISGAIQPVQEGDMGRGVNTGLSAALSGALRLGGTGTSEALKFIQQLQNPQGLRDMVTGDIIDRMGTDEARRLANIARFTPEIDPVLGTKQLTAGVTDSLDLAPYERMSRASDPASYAAIGEGNDALRRKFLAGLEVSDEQLLAAEELRTLRTTPAREAVTDSNNLFRDEAVQPYLLRSLTSGGAAGSTSNELLNQMMDTLNTSPTMATPTELLFKANRDLAHGLNPTIATKNNFRNAIADTPFANELLAISTAQLDAATRPPTQTSGGLMSDYLATFREQSKAINEMNAIREMNKELGITPLTGISPPDVEKLSTRGLSGALEKVREKVYGNPLTPETDALYNYVTDDIRKGNMANRVSGMGSSGDMDTKMKLLSNLEGPVIGFRTPLLAGLRATNSYVSGGSDKALTSLMQNPREYARAVADVLRDRAPETLGKRLNEARMYAALTSGTSNIFLKDHSNAQR